MNAQAQSITAEWPYRFELIRLDDTYVDHRYQRQLKEIVKPFDPRLVGAMTVSERQRSGKNLSVIDGQRRRDKIVADGALEVVPACVFYGLSLEQEAELFSLFQRERKSITPFERFRSELVARVPQALEINRIVKQQGFEIAEHDATMRDLKAVAGIERLYKEDPEKLRQTLHLVRETWDGVPWSSRDPMLKGVAAFIDLMKGNLDEAKFIERLKNSTPSDLARKADMLRESKGLSGKSPKFTAEVIEQQYRRARR